MSENRSNFSSGCIFFFKLELFVQFVEGIKQNICAGRWYTGRCHFKGFFLHFSCGGNFCSAEPNYFGRGHDGEHVPEII